MESSLYTCIQDIQNGDREQALALLEKFSPLLKKYAFFLQSEDALPDFQCFLLAFAKNLQLNELTISTDGANGSNNRVSIIRGIQVPNDAIGVSRIIVQRVPAFAPLQNNSDIAIASEIFQRPTLIRVVRAVEKVNRFTVFYSTILVIAQDVHVFTCSYVLNLVVMVEFVCHF